MGQTASKVAASLTGRASTATSRAAVPPIPSIPGKSGRPGPVVDPLTGFTRGTAPLLPAEEQQRQFLEAKQGTRRDPVTGQPLPYQDKLPDDLLQFLNDLGPVQTKVEPRPQTQGHRPSRAPRRSSSLEPDEADTTAVPTRTAATKPGHDPTRHVVAMPLAEQIPHYETSRTTSFSVRPDDTDKEPDPVGANALQLFALLSGRTSIDQHLAATAVPPPTTASEATSSAVDPEVLLPRRILEQALQYIQTPVLLKDLEDGGYVGAWPNRVAELQTAHPQLMRLDTQTRAQLVVEDLWAMEQRAAAPASTSRRRH